jgi:hypothetical protein
MSPYRKTALLLIRLIAFGCMLLSVLLIGANFVLVRTGSQSADGVPMLVVKSLPFVLGFILMLKGSAIARRLTEDFDE